MQNKYILLILLFIFISKVTISDDKVLKNEIKIKNYITAEYKKIVTSTKKLSTLQ